MKKRIVLFLMILVSVSMLISSFARAQSTDQESSLDTFCSSANQQGARNIEPDRLREAKLRLTQTRDPRKRAVLLAAINKEQKENDDYIKALDANCP